MVPGVGFRFSFQCLTDLDRPSWLDPSQIGAGFIPKNLDTSLLDGVIQVSKEEAFEMTKRAAKEEGILAGISSGATMAAWCVWAALVAGESLWLTCGRPRM